MTATATAADYGSGPCIDGECCAHRRALRASIIRRLTPPPSTTNNSSSPSAPRTIVIGAGPSGLTTLQCLLSKGIPDVILVESSSRIGGVFSTAHASLTMTSSSLMTCFSAFPIDDDDDDVTMWSCADYVRYLERFVEHFSLRRHIRFNTTVTEVKRRGNDGRWDVVMRIEGAAEAESNVFDAVAVCAGAHQVVRLPSWANDLTIPSLHSSDLLSREYASFNSIFADKAVVIVGLGESGSDLALHIAPHAKSVRISIRSKNGPGYVTPRYTGTEVTDLNTNRRTEAAWSPHEFHQFATLVAKAWASGDTNALEQLSMVWTGKRKFEECELMAIEINDRYRNHPYDRFGTKNYSFLEAIRKHDARIIGEIMSAADVPPNTDVVVFCTGYTTRFPFFPSYQANAFDNHRDRWLHMIDIDTGPSLAFIGYSRPAFGAVPPLSEMSARLWALLLLGQRTITTDDAREERDKHRSYEERLFKRDALKLPTLVQYQRQMDSLAKRIGCMPPLAALKVNHRDVYERVISSCFSGAQFRLCGDGATEAAWQHVAGMPLPKFSRQHREALWEVIRRLDAQDEEV